MNFDTDKVVEEIKRKAVNTVGFHECADKASYMVGMIQALHDVRYHLESIHQQYKSWVEQEQRQLQNSEGEKMAVKDALRVLMKAAE